MILLLLYNYVKNKRKNIEKNTNSIFYDIDKEIDIISNITVFENKINNTIDNIIIKTYNFENTISKNDIKYHLKKGNTIINDNGKNYVDDKKRNISYVEDMYILQLFNNINNDYNYILNEIKVNKKDNRINILYKCMNIIDFAIDKIYNVPPEHVISKMRR